MKKIVFVLLIVLFLFKNGYAAPSISSISGVVSDGQSITISGSAFGSNSLTQEWTGANIEAGTDGDEFSKTRWSTAYYSARPRYETDEHHSGSKSIKFTFTTAGSEVGCAAEYHFPSTINYMYFTAWIKLHKDDALTSYQWKNWRLKDIEGHSFNYGIIGDNWHSAAGWVNDVALFALGCSPDSGKEHRNGPIYTDSFLFDAWQRIECWYTTDQVEWRRIGRATDEVINCIPTDGWHGACDCCLNCPSDTFEWLRIGHYYSNLGAGGGDMKVYYDDIYIDTTRARVEIGNNAVWASCTHREIQNPTAWAASSITVTVNAGSISDLLDGNYYLFVVDSSGVASSGYLLTYQGGGPGHVRFNKGASFR